MISFVMANDKERAQIWNWQVRSGHICID